MSDIFIIPRDAVKQGLRNTIRNARHNIRSASRQLIAMEKTFRQGPDI